MELLQTTILAAVFYLLTLTTSSPLPQSHLDGNILVPDGCIPSPFEPERSKCTMITLTGQGHLASAWALNSQCRLIGYSSDIRIDTPTIIVTHLGGAITMTIPKGGRNPTWHYSRHLWGLKDEHSNRCALTENDEWQCSVPWSCEYAGMLNNYDQRE